VPIPSGDLPGHSQVRERVEAALNVREEGRAVEFKESAPWESLQYKLVKTAIAMANLRDGGIIIVGVSQRGDEWDVTGITDLHLATYDTDSVVETVNRYASPSVAVSVVRVAYEEKQFLALSIREFDSIPVICRKDGPNLREGAFYLRPAGMPRTEEVRSIQDLRDVLDLAIDKGVRQFVERARRAGLEAVPTQQPFDDELEGL